MNIKFCKDFVKAVYHNDNNQIQIGIKRYKNNKKKISSWDTKVNKEIENKFNEIGELEEISKQFMSKIMSKSFIRTG